jgi:hypothetical protein
MSCSRFATHSIRMLIVQVFGNVPTNPETARTFDTDIGCR